MARSPWTFSSTRGQTVVLDFNPSLEAINRAYRELGEGLAERAIKRAQNETGGLMRTQVARTIAQVTKVKYGAVRSRMSTRPAGSGSLDFSITMRSAVLSLLDPAVPRARQTRVGVVSGAWGGNTYPKAFIATMPNGHRGVFWKKGEGQSDGGGRQGIIKGGKSKTLARGGGGAAQKPSKRRKGRLPIREVYGPHLPNEMVDEKKTTAPKAARDYDAYFGQRFEKHYTYFFNQVKAKHGL